MKTANISVELLGYFGNDNTVANAARVSFHKEASNYTDEQNEKLINYLAKHKHFSPFNHAFLSFRVKAPIFVSRQMVKHKFLPWNEESRRYVDDTPEFYLPEYWRARAENVKQGSSEDKVDIGFWRTAENWYPIQERMEEYTSHCLEQYEDMLKAGVAPEQARMVLPQNMMTNWVWSGTLGAFLDMLVLRLDPHAQKESRIVAELISKHVQELFPVSYNARIQ